MSQTDAYTDWFAATFHSNVRAPQERLSRLADCILVFDDWPHRVGHSEQRAFAEWLSLVPHLQFDFLFYNT
jgi:hypothetical protein